MSRKRIENLVDYVFDVDEMKAIVIHANKRLRELEKEEQKRREDAAWERLRHVKVGDRIYPHRGFEAHSLRDYARIHMMVPVGDYLIVDYVHPRSHALWLRKKEAPANSTLTRAEARAAEERMDTVYFSMDAAIRHGLSTEAPAVNVEVPA